MKQPDLPPPSTCRTHLLTELGQFVIQFIAGLAMLVAVMAELGGFSSLWTVWDEPKLEGHAEP
ncbi:hypothetical protein, partial [Streptomyces zhihengii]